MISDNMKEYSVQEGLAHETQLLKTLENRQVGAYPEVEARVSQEFTTQKLFEGMVRSLH